MLIACYFVGSLILVLAGKNLLGSMVDHVNCFVPRVGSVNSHVIHTSQEVILGPLYQKWTSVGEEWIQLEYLKIGRMFYMKTKTTNVLVTN